MKHILVKLFKRVKFKRSKNKLYFLDVAVLKLLNSKEEKLKFLFYEKFTKIVLLGIFYLKMFIYVLEDYKR
jgi:hypothetical protein